jgi:hypothetical protein
MLKKITLLLALVIMTASIIEAQWVNQGAWPVNPPEGALYKTGQNHSTAVDPDGKVWVGRYANVAKYVVAPGDTLPKSVYLLYVFNPDGTQASFSPIFHVMGDTMYSTTQRGMRTNIDGNIILATGFPSMYIIDYKTGKGLKRVTLPSTNGPNGPCVAADGTIFIGTVFSGQRPVEMYDQNLTLIGSAITVAPGFSRSFEVSKDGNTIYWAGYTTGKVYVYKRADEFSAFEIKDSIMNGARVESFAWRPNTNQLWMSGGSQNDLPSPPYTKGTWYAYDVVQNKVVDSLKWKWKDETSEATKAERPRALAFTPDGNTAYIGCFGVGAADLLQKVVLGGSSVKALDELPTGYELSQNYPNPFNPTTNIKFSIPEQGFISLKVYNTIGEEVATLLDTFKGVGTYEVSFDASQLASGIYMYKLTTGTVTLSKKMLLVK